MSRSLCRGAMTLVVAMLATAGAAAQAFDLVILHGRAIDPETRLDAVRNIGIADGIIARITTEPIDGRRTIDARGLVVAPGFIDMHSHSPTLLGAHFQVLDGVTTQLDLEAGAYPVDAYGEHFAGGAVLNYGASVAHFAIRTLVMEGRAQPYLFTGTDMLRMGAAFHAKASPAQIADMRRLLLAGLDAGGLGIGVVLDYMGDAVSDDELRMVFATAAERTVPVFIHVRRGVAGDPAGLDEVIALAKNTGAPVLIAHINHSAMQAVGDWLAKIDRANAAGARIATETMTYGAGGASISSAVFSRDWRKIFNIDYEDVQWTATGEWLTKETWERYRVEQPTGLVNHHYVKEAWIETALAWPGMMVVSDATPAFSRDILANPNIAGTYSRLLGYYVRERKIMSLSDALARASLLPARWLEQASPAFKRKGRLQEGADADVVIFDALSIRENATYGAAYLKPTGMVHVIVGGRPVVSDGEVIAGRYPGVHMRGRRD